MKLTTAVPGIWPTLKAKLKAIIKSEVTESVPVPEAASVPALPQRSSVDDPEATARRLYERERKRAYRAKKAANLSGTCPNVPENVPNVPENVPRDTPSESLPSILSSEERKKEGGDGGDVRATEPLVSNAAFDLADEAMTILGIDLSFVPPAWCGFAMWLQGGLTSGWQPELVRLAARKVAAARRREGPPHSFRYLGKPIVREHELAALPVPAPRQIAFPFASNVVEIPHGRPDPSDWRARNDAAHAALAEFSEGVARRKSERGGS